MPKSPKDQVGLVNDPEVLSSQTRDTPTKVSYVSFEGPLPPPGILEGYNKVNPTFADRIMVMTESRVKHINRMETADLWTSRGLTLLGSAFGFLLAFGGLAGGYFLIYEGRDATGFLVAFCGIAPVLGARIFTYSRKPLPHNHENDKP